LPLTFLPGTIPIAFFPYYIGTEKKGYLDEKEVSAMRELMRFEEPMTMLEPLFENLFESNFFNRLDRDVSETIWPRIDIVEEPDSFVLRADVPGVEKDDISINVEGDTLMISGEKKGFTEEQGKGKYYHLERTYGSFCRSFTLPSSVDREKKIEAHYKNGVLELMLRKSKESASKQIEVKID
jgi:HSP20 family protein